MDVLDERVGRDLPVATAHGDDREFAVERHEAFEDERPAAELLPRRLAVGRRAEHGLPLAVVAEPACLQHGGQADVADGGVEVRRGSRSAANGGVGMPSDAKNCFSASRSCETSSARGGGKTGTRSASQRAVSTGTFSNSNVTTSEAFASS